MGRGIVKTRVCWAGSVFLPVHNGLLRCSGFEVLYPFATHAPGKADDAARAQILARYNDCLRHVQTAQTLFFHPGTDYGADERLLPGVIPASGFQHRPRQTVPGEIALFD